MKCKNCFNLEKMKDYARGDVYDWCVVKHDNPDTDMERDCPFYKPRTNYDRIISKSPEELARLFCDYYGCPIGRGYPACGQTPTDPVCTGCWLDWLKQEEENAKLD